MHQPHGVLNSIEVSDMVCEASLYAFAILRKDDQCVEGQPLEMEAVAE